MFMYESGPARCRLSSASLVSSSSTSYRPPCDRQTVILLQDSVERALKLHPAPLVLLVRGMRVGIIGTHRGAQPALARTSPPGPSTPRPGVNLPAPRYKRNQPSAWDAPAPSPATSEPCPARATAAAEKVQVAVARDEVLHVSFGRAGRRLRMHEVNPPGLRRAPLVRVRALEGRLARGRESRVAAVRAHELLVRARCAVVRLALLPGQL